MSKSAPKDAVLEILKKIQGSLADVRNAQADMRRDIRSMKDEIVSLRAIMGEFIKTDARRETDYLNLASRVERIEDHLDLRDH